MKLSELNVGDEFEFPHNPNVKFVITGVGEKVMVVKQSNEPDDPTALRNVEFAVSKDRNIVHPVPPHPMHYRLLSGTPDLTCKGKASSRMAIGADRSTRTAALADRSIFYENHYLLMPMSDGTWELEKV